MKNTIKCKSIIISIVVVLVFNIIAFGILTVVQAPYYNKAPAETDSIYELYASEEYSDVLYWSSRGLVLDEEEIPEIEKVLKSVSAKKMDKTDSYFRMMSLHKKSYALMASGRVYEDREIAKTKLIASSLLFYLQDDRVYIACVEFTEYSYSPENQRIAIYETDDVALREYLSEHQTADGFHQLIPEWRDDISNIGGSLRGKLYVLFVAVEFVVVVFITNKIFVRNTIPAKKQKKSTNVKKTK